VLEIASWAVHRGLAEAVILQFQPGLAFRLDAAERSYVRAGTVHPELAESFALQGRPLPADAKVVRTATDAWEIYDRTRDVRYRIQEAGEALEVTLPDHFERPEFLAAVRRFAESRADQARFVGADGSLAAEARDALMAVGGRFIAKLIEFRPHVVGRRVEAGQMDDVTRFVRAVRMFSEAEVVLGGPTATSHPVDVLAESGADYLFAGEAEEPFCEFLRLAWERNSRDRVAEIPGLAYWYGGEVRHNTLPSDGYERTVLDDPAKVKAGCPTHVGRSLRDRHSRLGETRPCDWPAHKVPVPISDVPISDASSEAQTRRCLRDAIRPTASREVVAGNRLDWSLLEGFAQEFESLYFTGGRGCPGACTFCAKLHGPEVRVKSAEQILEEIAAADAKITEGVLRVSRWELFQHVDDARRKHRLVAWAAIYDEDFFLDRRRAVEFFRLWQQSPLADRYRISVQTNPCSFLDASGRAHADLFHWIDRVKPMIQLGAESFHPEMLRRWHKRHTVTQLRTVLDALDATRQDYSIFILLTDFDSTPEEVIETLRLLVLEGFNRRRMRIASSAFTIPLYDSDTRRLLEYGGRPASRRIGHFTDYETPQPGWLDPFSADLADAADAELRFALNLPQRDGAMMAALEAVADRLARERASVQADPSTDAARRARIEELHRRVEWTIDQVKEARFRAVDTPGARPPSGA
jgi:hypothetical protein